MKALQAAHMIYNVFKVNGRRWKIDGELREPTVNDIEELVNNIFEDIGKTDYDSVESGGILIKRDGDNIDVYVHLGELHEDISL